MLIQQARCRNLEWILPNEPRFNRFLIARSAITFQDQCVSTRSLRVYRRRKAYRILHVLALKDSSAVPAKSIAFDPCRERFSCWSKCAFRTLNRRASCACTRDEAFSSSVESCSHASPSQPLWSIDLRAASPLSHRSLLLAHILNQSTIDSLIGRLATGRINLPAIRLPKEAETAWPLHPQAPPLPHRRRRFVHTLSQLPSIRPQTELLHLRTLHNGFQSKLLYLLSHLRMGLPCGRKCDETYWLTCGPLSSSGNTNSLSLAVVA